MAKLDAKARKAIPAKNFAGPDRSYPIEDASHARDALARSSGKPVHAAVEQKVKAKYPGMAVGGKVPHGHEGHAMGKGTHEGHHLTGMEAEMHRHADLIHKVGRD